MCVSSRNGRCVRESWRGSCPEASRTRWSSQNFFGSPEELRASRACPSEHRIEGQLHLTQEQIPLSTEIMEHLTAMLQDHDVNVKESRKPVGGHLSGTERRFYPINARANVVDHSNVGVARMGPTDQLK